RRDELGLDAEQACVLDRYHRDLGRAGATLPPADQARLREINERLSALTAQFRHNLHEETAALAVRVKTAAELDGLPEPTVDAARAESERHTAAPPADGQGGPLEPWDWPYYAARERRARHAVDDARLQEFFVLDRVIEDGLFAVAEALYGLRFVPRPDLPRP